MTIQDDKENGVENYRGFSILFSDEDWYHTNYVSGIGMFSNFYSIDSLIESIDECLDKPIEWYK
ncbi:hypothetical protein LM1A4_048 [Leuconostoc phage 1-A4]|uniref:Uncharacterized protein n=1 Tax=Leuconostoc phage 1-A4 TaxID=745088 RepID=D4N4M1_9CAUD|nr:hypothetical protein LM1A4_048 [Leuconostoc phage 1-A4]ADD71771.1 hypothetical protein LM1A4_048 [Leuconostoc phage 1-A4]